MQAYFVFFAEIFVQLFFLLYLCKQIVKSHENSTHQRLAFGEESE